ncbi:MAG: hypothetical protein ACR2J6_06650 [Thermoleophilaceae bacterium]
MATVSAPTTRRRSDVINAARRQLKVLESVGPVALFGAQAHRWTDDLVVQRIDVEDVAAVGDRAVALMVQRGRDHDGLWVERRISAVLNGDAEPILYGSWVDGLDAASRA